MKHTILKVSGKLHPFSKLLLGSFHF